jgi:chromosome segregation ATPase
MESLFKAVLLPLKLIGYPILFFTLIGMVFVADFIYKLGKRQVDVQATRKISNLQSANQALLEQASVCGYERDSALALVDQLREQHNIVKAERSQFKQLLAASQNREADLEEEVAALIEENQSLETEVVVLSNNNQIANQRIYHLEDSIGIINEVVTQQVGHISVLEEAASATFETRKMLREVLTASILTVSLMLGWIVYTWSKFRPSTPPYKSKDFIALKFPNLFRKNEPATAG